MEGEEGDRWEGERVIGGEGGRSSLGWRENDVGDETPGNGANDKSA